MRISKIWLITFLLAVFMAGCGGKSVEGGGPPAPPFDADHAAPTVVSTNPVNLDPAAPINRKLTANFSEAVDPATCTATTFTLSPAVAGAVTCVGSTAVFTPTGPLTIATLYTATVTTGFTDLAGNHLAANKVWTFTGAAADATAPTVTSTDPLNNSTGVPVNKEPAATFSEAIDPATVNTGSDGISGTFTLTFTGSGPGCVFDPITDPDPGCVPAQKVQGSASTTGTGNVATFVPLFTLTPSTTGASAITQTYTATLTTGVKDLAGNALAAPFTWSFVAGAGASAGPPQGAGPAGVPLGTSAGFVILAKSGVSTVPASVITGNVGVSPASHTALTGFSETLDTKTNEFSTSPQVKDIDSSGAVIAGKIFAADYHSPTPANLTAAVGDMERAYTDAAGRTAPAPTVNLGAGDISNMTLAPGLYKWTTGLNIDNRGVTLAGTVASGPNDVWIFQIAGDLTVANGAIVTLSGGAVPKNVFWQVGGQATLGTTANFKGTILSQTLISLNTGAVLTGRALAQTAVTLIQNTVTKP